MRLNKYIADAGVCSRRKADEMINPISTMSTAVVVASA